MSTLFRFKNYLLILGLIVFVAIMLVVSVRGLPGNPTPTQLNTPYWKNNGPFELSPERGRFAFLYSFVENHSFYLQPSLAQFTAPDVGYWKDHYVSIFPPAISFIAIPGYLIGRHFDLSQYGTFLWMSLFALCNVLLIRLIAIRLGSNAIAATIAGITFLFATPAFAYAVTIYEHHISTFFILLSIYLFIRFNSLLSILVFWIVYAFAFTVDYPNLFMMFPLAIATFFKSFFIENLHEHKVIKISFLRVLSVLAVIIPLTFLLWFNQMSYGNPLKISGTVPTILSVKANGKPNFGEENMKKKVHLTSLQIAATPQHSALNFFKPINMLNGFYILLLSPDRGVLVYTPVILFGIVGLFIANKKKQKYIPLLVGIIGFNFLLYSMWGDPYGGFAFGGRYLIPSYAILAIYLALFLTVVSKKKILLFLFFLVFIYSVSVNTIGALTSNAIPPQIQATVLSRVEHRKVNYTFMHDVNILNSNNSKSFIFQQYAKRDMTAWQFDIVITGAIIIFIFVLLLIMNKKKIQYAEKNSL